MSNSESDEKILSILADADKGRVGILYGRQVIEEMFKEHPETGEDTFVIAVGDTGYTGIEKKEDGYYSINYWSSREEYIEEKEIDKVEAEERIANHIRCSRGINPVPVDELSGRE